MKDFTKKYSNGEITIVWQPAKCIHSAVCWRGKEGVNGLPEVFKPKENPWITMDGAATQRIIEQVTICPSGALSFYWNKDEAG